LVSNWEKIWFMKLDILNWRIGKNPVQIDMGKRGFASRILEPNGVRL
jgi:hypothetical protein